MIGCIRIYSAPVRCESDGKSVPAALRAPPLLAIARCEGSPCGWFSGDRYRSAPLVLVFSWDRHRPAGLTLPAGTLRCRSAPAVRQVNRPGWSDTTACNRLPWRRAQGRAPAPPDRGGRVSHEPATHQRSRWGRSGPNDRRERVTERHHAPAGSEEHGAGSMVRGAGRAAADGEEFTTKPGASEYQARKKSRGTVRVERSGGAPDRREERKEMERKEQGAPSGRREDPLGIIPEPDGRHLQNSDRKETEDHGHGCYSRLVNAPEHYPESEGYRDSRSNCRYCKPQHDLFFSLMRKRIPTCRCGPLPPAIRF